MVIFNRNLLNYRALQHYEHLAPCEPVMTAQPFLSDFRPPQRA